MYEILDELIMLMAYGLFFVAFGFLLIVLIFVMPMTFRGIWKILKELEK